MECKNCEKLRRSEQLIIDTFTATNRENNKLISENKNLKKRLRYKLNQDVLLRKIKKLEKRITFLESSKYGKPIFQLGYDKAKRELASQK